MIWWSKSIRTNENKIYVIIYLQFIFDQMVNIFLMVEKKNKTTKSLIPNILPLKSNLAF